MATTDLEYLLKEKIVVFSTGLTPLLTLVWGEMFLLREDNRGNTISEIFVNEPKWAEKEVSVLPSPLVHQELKRVKVQVDPKLESNQIKFVYFDAFEVKEF